MELFKRLVETLISDSYTLIVGFVAIGIPLALQIAVNASEKFDNSLLAKRLTTGWIINPIVLIVLSTIYVCISLSIKLFYPIILSSSCFLNNYLSEVKATLAITFLLIMIGAGYFYIRFYYRILKTTEKYISEFLLLDPLLLGFIKKLNNFYSCSIFYKLVVHLESRKFTKKEFASISAGLEVLISQLNKKSWEKTFVDLLFKINNKINRSYFKQYQQPSPKLSSSDILLIKMYWDALIRIIKLSRSNYDTKLSFHSQRLLSSLAIKLIHHPQYEDIATNEFNIEKEEKINWSHDLYEIARWQSQQDTQGIDLVLECEWSRDLCDLLAEPDYRHSRLGTVQALRIFTDILELVAKKHPEKIFSVYKNFSEGMPSYYGHDHFSISLDESTKWENVFWVNFYQKYFSLEGEDKVTDELISLKDGRAYLKYGEYGISRPLTEQELNSSYSRVNYKEIYKKSYLDYCDFLSLKFIAILSYFQRWEELKYCLEWAKPRDSQVNYVGNVLLASSGAEVEQLIFRKFESVNDNHWFFERHDILPYVFRGLLFQLTFYYEKNGTLNNFYTSGELVDSRKQTRILNLLINQYDHVKDCTVFDQRLISEVVDKLKQSLQSLESRAKKLLINSEPSYERWEQFKIDLESGWHTQEISDCWANSFMNMMNFTFTHKVLPVEIQILNLELDKEDFIEGFPSVSNNDFWGRKAFDNMVFPIFKEMQHDAVECTDEENTMIDEALIMASAVQLNDMGFLRTKKFSPLWMHPDKNWKGISVSDSSTDKALFIDTKNVKLLCTNNLISNKNRHPLFTYYINGEEGKILVKASAYIEIQKTHSKSCLLI